MNTNQNPNGVLYLVATPIGNLGDMTYRAVDVLKASDVIAAEDTRTSKRLLDHYAIGPKRMVSYFGPKEHARAETLLHLLLEGKNVALITDAGTPGISDPAVKVVRRAVAHGIRVIPVPGASALLAGLSGSGLDISAFTFEGFLPIKSGRRMNALKRIAEEPRTVALFESTHRIAKLLDELELIMPERRIVVARELTKIYEEFLRGTPAEIKARMKGSRLKGEMVVLIPASASHPLELQADAEGD